ncbi:MAG: acyloxyacyl hydrolase, partial [Bacteroides sp.]
THFSNGNTNYPNAGVNVVGGRIGIVRTFGEEKAVDRTAVPNRIFVKPHVSYDLVFYGATHKKGYIKNGSPSLVPGSFGVLGLNVAPMYNFNNYFRAGISVDAQYDESANIEDYQTGASHPGNLTFYRPPFCKQFAAGLSLRAELVMPVFSINAGIGRNLIYSGDDMKGFYQVLAIKTYVTRHLFLHVG